MRRIKNKNRRRDFLRKLAFKKKWDNAFIEIEEYNKSLNKKKGKLIVTGYLSEEYYKTHKLEKIS